MQLLQIYQPFMVAVLQISEGRYSLLPEGEHQQLRRLWSESEEAVAKLGWPKALVVEGSFAVCVWADEQLLLSSQTSMIAWKPLQTQLYQTQCGGEEFFSRLETLLTRYGLIEKNHPSRKILDEVLALFGACLSCRFKGRYYHSDAPELQRLRQRIVEQLGLKKSLGFEIFPLESAPQQLSDKHWRRIDPFSVLLMAAVLLGTLVVLLIYQELLATYHLSFPGS